MHPIITVIIRFLLASGLYVALLVGLYFGITNWNSAVKQSPEYKLIAMTEALQACDVEQFNQAVNLNAVVKSILQSQLKSESDSLSSNGMLDEATINQLIASQQNTMVQDFETKLAKCDFMGNNTRKIQGWVVPTLHLLVSTKTLMGYASIVDSKLSEDKQSASFTFQVNIPQLKNAALTFELVQRPPASASETGENLWQVVGLKLNAAALANLVKTKA